MAPTKATKDQFVRELSRVAKYIEPVVTAIATPRRVW